MSDRIKKLVNYNQRLGKLTKEEVANKGTNVAKFIDSDIKSINLVRLLRTWMSQLIDNSLSGNPTYIEVRFYDKGSNGFDIVDNGTGYTQSELSVICKCLERRERNEIYKTKSIGFRGEALNSLCKSS